MPAGASATWAWTTSPTTTHLMPSRCRAHITDGTAWVVVDDDGQPLGYALGVDGRRRGPPRSGQRCRARRPSRHRHRADRAGVRVDRGRRGHRRSPSRRFATSPSTGRTTRRSASSRSTKRNVDPSCVPSARENATSASTSPHAWPCVVAWRTDRGGTPSGGDDARDGARQRQHVQLAVRTGPHGCDRRCVAQHQRVGQRSILRAQRVQVAAAVVAVHVPADQRRDRRAAVDARRR